MARGVAFVRITGLFPPVSKDSTFARCFRPRARSRSGEGGRLIDARAHLQFAALRFVAAPGAVVRVEVYFASDRNLTTKPFGFAHRKTLVLGDSEGVRGAERCELRKSRYGCVSRDGELADMGKALETHELRQSWIVPELELTPQHSNFAEHVDARQGCVGSDAEAIDIEKRRKAREGLYARIRVEMERRGLPERLEVQLNEFPIALDEDALGRSERGDRKVSEEGIPRDIQNIDRDEPRQVQPEGSRFLHGDR
jgi:hypothetical protein